MENGDNRLTRDPVRWQLWPFFPLATAVLAYYLTDLVSFLEDGTPYFQYGFSLAFLINILLFSWTAYFQHDSRLTLDSKNWLQNLFHFLYALHPFKLFVFSVGVQLWILEGLAYADVPSGAWSPQRFDAILNLAVRLVTENVSVNALVAMAAVLVFPQRRSAFWMLAGVGLWNFYAAAVHYYEQLRATGACDFLADLWAGRAARLLTIDWLAFNLLFLVFVYAETSRYKVLVPHSQFVRLLVPWIDIRRLSRIIFVLVQILFGFEIAAPLFILQLTEAEMAKPLRSVGKRRIAQSYLVLYLAFMFVELTGWFLAMFDWAWEEGELADRVTLALKGFGSTRTLYALWYTYLTLCLYALPQIDPVLFSMPRSVLLSAVRQETDEMDREAAARRRSAAAAGPSSAPAAAADAHVAPAAAVQVPAPREAIVGASPVAPSTRRRRPRQSSPGSSGPGPIEGVVAPVASPNLPDAVVRMQTAARVAAAFRLKLNRWRAANPATLNLTERRLVAQDLTREAAESFGLSLWSAVKRLCSIFSDLAAALAALITASMKAWILRFLLTFCLFANVTGTFALFLVFREQISESVLHSARQNPLGEPNFVTFLHNTLYALLFVASVFAVLGGLRPEYLHVAAVVFGALVAVLAATGQGFRRTTYARAFYDWLARDWLNTLFGVVATLAAVRLLAFLFVSSRVVSAPSVSSLPSAMSVGMLNIVALLIVAYVLWELIYRNKSYLPTVWKVLMIAGLGLGLIYENLASLQTCRLELGREYVGSHNYPPATDASITDALSYRTRRETVNFRAPSGRDQHAASHGCVRATFTVEPQIGAQYRHGIFEPLRSYPAWIRLSNYGRHPDNKAQARGFAMKLMGVPGEKLIKEGASAEKFTHDFLLINSETFFTGDATAYPAFLEAMSGGGGAGDVLAWVFPSWNPFKWRLSAVWGLRQTYISGSRFLNPLNWQYYSGTPYQLGLNDMAVKYSVRPCPASVSDERVRLDRRRSREHPDVYLRENMRQLLSSNGSCYEFLVQAQEEPCLDPIEDPTVVWTGPWAKLATITIPPQNFLNATQMEFCEQLSFNPWHAPTAHRPLGAINQARRRAYETGAALRRDSSWPEPDGSETFDSPALIDVKAGAGFPDEFDYATYPPPFHRLPKHVKTLPKNQNFDVTQFLRIGQQQVGFITDRLLKQAESGGKRFADYTEPEDYRYMFIQEERFHTDDRITLPPVYKRWRQDEEFARQYIAGVNPTMIQHVTPDRPLPAALLRTLDGPMRNKIDTTVLRGQPSMERLEQSGRLFFADYEILSDIVSKANRVFYAPMVVFYLNDSNVLLPLLIQLTRYENATNEIYLPHDGLVWLFARMHVAQADSICHEIVAHLGFTHLALEPVIVAFYRQLNKSHPVFRMIRPHFHNTLAINNLGRNTLLAAKGSLFDQFMGCGIRGSLQLMAKAFETYNFTERAFPNAMKARGFDEIKDGVRDVLPGYLYRDDGFLLWNALKDYVRSVVTKYYKNDLAIQRDRDLQALHRELSDPLMANVRGVPPFDSIDAVVDVLTNVAFTAAGQHSAVNFGQYDYYAFIPNRPLSLTAAMPTDRQLVTMEYIMRALPDRAMTVQIIATGLVLTLPPQYFVPSTDFNPFHAIPQLIYWGIAQFPKAFEASTLVQLESVLHNDDILPEYRRFHARLMEMEELITRRISNTSIVAYPYLKPSETASSIAI